jgi:hypothetical protein
VDGGCAYVAGWEAGLLVIDISTPSAPFEVGFVDTLGDAWGVAVAGSYAYVADLEAGLRVIDVSTPSAPFQAGFVDTPGAAYDVAISGGFAYVADGDSGLRVVAVGNPWAPVEMAFVDTARSAFGVAVANGYAYVAANDEGLRVIDVSPPSAPVEVGFVDTPGDAWGVAVAGGYAYVADGAAGLRVINVNTPAAPVEVGFVHTPGSTLDVAVAAGYAYVGVWGAGLRVIDVSTPTAPFEVGSLDTLSSPVGVAVAGGHAYVADTYAGLRVIDVSTPSAPVEVGFVDTPGDPQDVAVMIGYAYVADRDAGLRVIDVSTPSAPVEVGIVDTPGSAFGVAVSRGYAYVACGGFGHPSSGLRVIDVSVPSAPVEVGFVGTLDYAFDVAASGGYAFLAASGDGLYVLSECTGPIADSRCSFIPAAAVAAGAQGAFFQTDLEINNTGTEAAQVAFQWLPRGEDNSEPVESDPIALAAGQSLRYENVLTELFGLGPDSLGALKMVASIDSVIGMSRTCNIPAGETAGTFGQGLPAIRATEMIQGTEPQRILFLSEDPDSRANVGCVNGTGQNLTINIGVFNNESTWLETRTMDLGPWSNSQINRIFEDYAPVNGYVDVWADSDEALYSCYGSGLDNLTSDPTTILPQAPSADTTYIPAAALASGLEGSFFQTDVDLNNVGSTDLTYELWWLPRSADNSEPVRSEAFSLAPGAGVRYSNVLDEVFGL